MPGLDQFTEVTGACTGIGEISARYCCLVDVTVLAHVMCRGVSSC